MYRGRQHPRTSGAQCVSQVTAPGIPSATTKAGTQAGLDKEAIVVRRVVEEDVTAPSTTVVEDDGSWIGRTLVTLVILALLVVGAVWLVNTISDNDGGVRDNTPTEQNDTGGETENNTDTDPVPSPASS